MAGVRLTVDFQGIEGVRARFNSLVLRLGDLTPMNDEIGSALHASTLHRFEKGVGPDGRAWPVSQRAEEEDGQTLIDTARLRNSLTWKAGTRDVEIGTNVIYAAIHQLGGKAGRGRQVTIPARPYLPDPMPADDIGAINGIVTDYLSGALR